MKKKKNIVDTQKKTYANQLDYLMESTFINCRVPRIVNMLLIREAQDQGILISELVRKYVYSITGWDKQEKRDTYIKEFKSKAF